MKTGEMLFDDLIVILTDKISVGSELICVNSKTEFLKCLEDIHAEVLQYDKYPFIHIETHGNVNGLEFSNGDFIEWADLSEEMQKINIATKNNLVIILASCSGANLFQVISEFERSPFYLLLGFKSSLSQGTVQDGFHEFYSSLFSNLDLIESIKKIIEILPDNTQDNLQVICIEDVMRIFWDEIKIRYTGENKKQRIQMLVENLKNKLPRSSKKFKIEKMKIIQDFQLKNKPYDAFNSRMDKYLMIDLYEENRHRFLPLLNVINKDVGK